MLYSIEYYYQKSLATAQVESMDCRMRACIFYPLLCQVKYWPEVTNYGDYIRKCYSIAQAAPVDDLRHQYISLKFRNKFALKKLLKQVDAIRYELKVKNLNDGRMGYTPITHIQEQLSQLEEEIRTEIASRKFW